MSLVNFIIYLREEVLTAINQDRITRLNDLNLVFIEVLEFAYLQEDKAVARIMQNLIDTLEDHDQGADWQKVLLSIEDIKLAVNKE